MTADNPKIIIQAYQNGEPEGEPKTVVLTDAEINIFSQSLETQPDEDGLVASNS